VEDIIGLALIAALYPLGLLVVSFLLRSIRPLPLGLLFLAGAAACLLVAGLAVVIIIRAAGLDEDSSSTARGGLRIAIGAAFILLGILVARRKPKQDAGQETGWKQKIRDPKPRTIFFLGVALYAPSATYIAAMQQIATNSYSWGQTLGLVVMVVAIVLLLVELPLITYAIAPDWTDHKIAPVQAWLEVHAQAVFAVVLAVLGVLMVIQGITDLT
jgi:hypothetical protein